MKNNLLVTTLLSFALIGPVYADDSGHKHQMKETGKPVAAPDQSAMTYGEVKRVSKGAGKLTIKHGPIANLDMPPMTMTFNVTDEKMLDAVKKGDTVEFKVSEIDGKMVITEMHAK